MTNNRDEGYLVLSLTIYVYIYIYFFYFSYFEFRIRYMSRIDKSCRFESFDFLFIINLLTNVNHLSEQTCVLRKRDKQMFVKDILFSMFHSQG